ncbi:equilibrative nucleoside transporter 3 [Rana temporaria]|uniref:equilibrative nucleoside transporter 3 n=1 Tax=Rana temporaria TaxID=8407 RepID=UPI001AAD56BE|nr:equilibrative nucleoside transporter 3 [Rana temporaria]
MTSPDSDVLEEPLGSTNARYRPLDGGHSEEDVSLLEENNVKHYYGVKPVDHFNGTYIIFFLLGVGSSLPWNFICTAKHYWIYKLRNCTDMPVVETPRASDLSDYFESYFSIASSVPSVPCLMLNFFLVNRLSSQVRILSSLLVMFLVFILVTVLVKVDTSTWTMEFFALSLVCIAILSGASNVLTASVFGVTGRFPLQHSQSLISGQAMGGTISALAAILDLSIASNVTDSALAYFLTADVFLLLCIAAYLLLPRIAYSNYYMNLSNEPTESSTSEDPAETVDISSSKTNSPPIIPILKKVKVLVACLFYTFFVSIIIFPTISAGIESVEKYTGSVWTNKYFTPLTCFLVYNFADWSGRQITTWIQVPGPNSRMLPAMVILRTFFIPLFMFCNYQPRKHIYEVFFQSDVYPIIFITLLGLSNGYLGTLSMVYGPKVVPKELSEGTAIVMSFFLGLGLAIGSAFSSLVHLI